MSAATGKQYAGSRREFITRLAAGLGGSAIAHWAQGSRGVVEAAQSRAVRSGKARLLTILHTAGVKGSLRGGGRGASCGRGGARNEARIQGLLHRIRLLIASRR